ncbi:hypothetical protein [Corynebacterium kroppenstedtii]|uniref:hypothetical protein n=1 Tax=Corynebacterium kroppenstedtii TaxID=161879 RepID=UPI0026ACCA96|nr:hypothetical protein [Corynebacterium kroppenstedtii]MDU7286850.1 hypothetical protein [Corynebacterium kroppenstedtii]
MALTLALDIGGTKIAWGLIDDDAPRTVIAHGAYPASPRAGTPRTNWRSPSTKRWRRQG